MVTVFLNSTYMFVRIFTGAGLNLFEGDIKGYNPRVGACTCFICMA